MKFLILTACLTFSLAAPAKQVLSKEAKDLLAETQGASALAAVTAPEQAPAAKQGISIEDLKVVPMIPNEATEAAIAATTVPELQQDKVEALSKTEATANLKENEIPLHLDQKAAGAGSESPIARVIMAILLLAVMGGGAFYLYRRHGKPGPRKNAPQIKILTQHYLGPKKSIAIIRVAGESILIGVTDHNISMIKSLALLDEEIPQEVPGQFATAMNDVEIRTQAATKAKESNDDEEFQISGLNQIKDVVSQRLKNMRSFE